MNILYDIRTGKVVKSLLYSNGLSLKDVINSNIITPSISNVIDYLLNGGGESAVAYAMAELADGAINWVLDPANNAVKYTVKGQSSGYGAEFNNGQYYTAESLCSAALAGNHNYPEWVASIDSLDTSGNLYFICKMPDGNLITYSKAYPSNGASDIVKSIPIDTVAAKVIANAEAGHAPSQEAVNNSIKSY